MFKTACALTVLAASSTTVLAAGDSVDLTVTGTISPVACTPALSAGGVIDYGTIGVSKLTAGDYTTLAVKSLDLTVTCDAPAKVAIKAISGRLGSVVSDSAEGTEGFAVAPVDLFGESGVEAAGLGLDGADKIGGYAARIAPSTSNADSTAVDTIISANNGTSWAATATPNITSNQKILSWAASGTTTPVALTTLTGTLEVQAYINKTSELDLTKEIALDGSTTIEIVYL